ncbi:MAG: hypothetical protein HDT18_03255 [Oscillibacter sp.]|nr:hypothetical protein [Oscillibacter sp.]
MMESAKKPEVSEVKSPAAENYKEIRPQDGMTPEKARAFWDGGSNNGELPSGEITEKKGGSYAEVKATSDGSTHEVHHMPADSASPLERNDGPAIKMEKADHRQTASCGSSREAREYCAQQRELIGQGKFREAVQMDIDDIRDQFGNKYDEAISEMLAYVDKLEQEGKINA